MFHLLLFGLVLARQGDTVVTHEPGHFEWSKLEDKPSHFKWDRLEVTYNKFSKMPINEKLAREQGWIKDGSGCDAEEVYLGHRYVKGDDKTTRLLFADDGKIAGIQATVKPNATFPSRKASSPWVRLSQKEALLTAYFRNPLKICRKSSKPGKYKPQKEKIGKELYIQVKSWLSPYNDKCKTMKVPKQEKRLKRQPWVKGQCFPQMGRHYWYDISRQSSCDNLFPVFLMFDEETKNLKAFGWAFITHVSSPRWLHPTEETFKYFFDLKTIPDCLKYQKMSAQHIYLSDPGELRCPQQ